MTLTQLLKKMYLIRNIIQGAYNIQSDVYIYIETYQHKQSVMAFSVNFRGLLTRYRPIFDHDTNQHRTTRFALFLEVFTELYHGRLKPMLDYLEKHDDVARFLNCNLATLERLYYSYKGKGGDTILLEEFSLLLDEDYTVIRVDLTRNCQKSDNESIKKEHLKCFFQKINDRNDTFFGNTPQKCEEYIKTMGSFYSSFYI